MTGYYYLDGVINREVVLDILGLYQDPSIDKYVIYLNSQGGETVSTDVITDVINANADNTELVVGEFLASNAVALVINTLAPIRFLDCFESIVIHRNRYDISTISLHNTNSYEGKRLKHATKHEKNMLSLFKKHLSSEQFKDYDSGKDVFLFGESAKKLIYAIKGI